MARRFLKPIGSWHRCFADEVRPAWWSAAGVCSFALGALTLAVRRSIGVVSALLILMTFVLIGFICLLTGAVQRFFDIAFELAEHLLATAATADQPSQLAGGNAGGPCSALPTRDDARSDVC